MNDNDLLPILNEVLGTAYDHTDAFSIKQLTRACLIFQLRVLLNENPDIQIFECRPTDAPKTGEQTLFYQLEPGALFHRVGETRTMRKLATAEFLASPCLFNRCPPSEARINVTEAGDDFFHVCPDTPVVEVLFQ